MAQLAVLSFNGVSAWLGINSHSLVAALLQLIERQQPYPQQQRQKVIDYPIHQQRPQ